MMLKDYNHDLVHALSEKNDAVWRYKKDYMKNAEECTHCVNMWKKIMEDDEKHIEMLRDEIQNHSKEGRFN